MTTPNARPTPPVQAEPSLPRPVILTPDPNPPTPWRRWKAFWFPHSDPTTLGFIRVTTGLLVLYIHLAYSLDLQAFFGKQAWYATSFIDRERHEGPSYIQPFFGDWNDEFAVMQLSDYPHRRQAFMDFLRGLPADARERELAMKYLNRLNDLPHPDMFREGVKYIMFIKTRVELDNSLSVLSGEKLEKEFMTDTYRMNIPMVLQNFPEDNRRLIAVEAGAFWMALDNIKWSDSIEGRKWMLTYLMEVGLPMRKAIIEYINALPEDPTLRNKRLDYMEYWNSDSRKAYTEGSGIFSLWFHVSDPTQMALVHTGVLILITLFTIGLFTRVTSVLVWVATVGYIHRSQQILFGMDTMMNILLFYLMIGNSGAALSVDRLIARYRATRASLMRLGTLDANTRAFLAYPPPSASAGFAVRLIQVHFCFIYMAAGLSKLKGSAWWDGRAFWDVVANPEFTLMPYSWYEKSLRGIASIKPLYYAMNVFAVWITLFVEIATPFLLWTRLRWLVIFLATAMHAVIGVLMGLNLFELLMIIMLIAFFPDRVIRDRFRGGLDLVRIALNFNPQNAKQARAAALAAAVDVDNQITLNADKKAAEVSVTAATDEKADDWKVTDAKGATGQTALLTLFKNLRLTSWLGFVLWVPGMKAFLAKRLLTTSPAVHAK
jgi:hypothetical protein